MTFINKKFILLIILLPTTIFSLDTWVGWNLGSVSLNHDYVTREDSGSLNFISLKFFDDDLRVGLNTNILSLVFDSNDNDYISIMPTEISFSPLRFADFSSIDIFVKGEIEKFDDSINPKFSYGIRFGILFKPQKEYIYYSPNASLQAIGELDSEYYGNISIDLDFGFVVLGVAILPIAVLSSISDDVRDDYQNNDPYYDENDPFYDK